HGAATVDPRQRGTKAGWWYRVAVPPAGRVELRLRLRRPEPSVPDRAGPDWWQAPFDTVVRDRERDADEFYAAIAPPDLPAERMRILRQSCAGLIWSKQMYPYGVSRWLDGDSAEPTPPPGHRAGRNCGWRHLDAFDVLAMPDPWEYPWFAAWDLAFHS